MTFSTLVHSSLLIENLTSVGFTKPTPIQSQVIPQVLQGKDVLASAQTGSGKTAAFALPLIEKLIDRQKLGANTTAALVLVPTRELAIQVEGVFRELSINTSLRTLVVYGGVKINPQMMQLRKGVDVLVATPGRLLDLIDKNALKLDKTPFLVLDEADKLLELGFQQEVDSIIECLPNKRQTLFFSATFSPPVKKLSHRLLSNPVNVMIAPQQKTASQVKQWLHPVDKKMKPEALVELLQQQKWPQCLVFVKTKKGANKVCYDLNKSGIKSETIHGDKSQQQRQKSLQLFKDKQCRVLVATDVAARGLDIEQLPAVVNLDLPKVATDYVHRIGRTGRAGESGVAVSFVCADEIDLLRAIESTIGQLIKRTYLDGFEPDHTVPDSVLKPSKKKKPHKKKLAKAAAKRAGQSKSAKKTTSKSKPKSNKKKSNNKRPKDNTSKDNSSNSGRKPPSFIGG